MSWCFHHTLGYLVLSFEDMDVYALRIHGFYFHSPACVCSRSTCAQLYHLRPSANDRCASAILLYGIPMADNATSKSETFCSPSADLILQSADGVHFHVHKVILAMSSQVLAGMCDLPQPDNDLQGIPVVAMPETSTTLHILLQLIYPDKHPEHVELSDLGDVGKAANKYDMQGVLAQLGQLLMLPIYIDKAPLRVFALACQYNLGIDLVKAAAKASLCHPPPTIMYSLSLPTELQSLSAHAYHSLLVYRQQCVGMLSDIFSEGAKNARSLFVQQDWKPVWLQSQCSCPASMNSGDLCGSLNALTVLS